MSRSLFIEPARAPYFDAGRTYTEDAPTYGAHNYFSGPASCVKRVHFEAALRAARPYFGGRAIDFGCADGVLLPSLAQHFRSVWAIEQDRALLSTAGQVVEHHALGNATLTCNEGGELPVRPQGWEAGADVLFLLETLEHVGDRERMWDSRAEFVEALFGLLRPGGRVLVTVPNMVGLGFLAQRVALRGLGLPRERKLSRKEFWRAVALGDTAVLERRWKAPHGHLGFNHRRLESALESRFEIVRRRHLLFQVLYVLARRGR